ncbi:T9SS type A sorting domain-containing protein [Mucilaginibacter sp.]|uniref:T9SS type A sorting domain-containing protein n=1 Tax=Mucilaginibacter sp. TaxID=1882438 RepID=UPI003D134294
MEKRVLFYLVVFILLMGVKSANAGSTYMWTGFAGTTDWTTNNNWYNTSTFSFTGWPGKTSTTDIAQIPYSNITINLTTSETISSLTTPNYGTSGATITFSGSPAPVLTIASVSLSQPYGLSTLLTFSGNGTALINSSLAFPYQGGFAIGSGATVTFPSGTAVTFNNPPTFVNNGTLNLNNATFTTSSATTNGGIINLTGSSSAYSTSNTITSTGAINNSNGALTTTSNITNSGSIIGTSGATFTLNGGAGVIANTNIITLTSSTITLNNNTCSIANTGSGVITGTNSTFSMAGAGTFINNAATFKATTCSFPFGNGNNIQNSGTFTTQAGCTFGLTTSGSYITNSGTFKDHGSTFTFTGQSGTVTNSGSSANMVLRGTTMNFGPTSNNGMGITNSNIFTADSASVILMATQNCNINNTGIFNAGTSGSACSITLSGQGAYIVNGTSSVSGTFNLGSTSVITPSGLSSYITNTVTSPTLSVFTLQSDAKGSATIGSLNTSTGSSQQAVCNGLFNVQRFLTGGSPSTTYRTYRILSSPVNISSNKSGGGNISLTNINTTAKVINPNAIAGTTTYYGAFTGGASGGGFTVTNANPTLYIYNETLNPTTASKNSTFTTGKNIGITSVLSNVVSTTSTINGVLTTKTGISIPVGNGYLLFFVGSINGRSTGATTLVPDNACITNIGTLNQQGVTVNLWYTPTGGSSGQLSFTSGELTANFPGVNMVGNPYASTIDLNKLYTDNYNASTNKISSNFYELYDKNPGQAYVVWSATGGTSSPSIASQYIASGQGFMAQTSGTLQTLTFQEDQKVYNPALINGTSTPPLLLVASNNQQAVAGNNFSGAVTQNAIALNAANTLKGLHLKVSQETDGIDEVGVYFNSKWSDKYDIDDALDLDGASSKVFLSSYTSDGVRTAINKLTDFTKNKTVKLFVKGTTDGLYNLSLTDMVNIDTTLYNVFLLDHFAKDSLDLRRYKSYAFRVTTADTTSYGANRFELAIERVPLPKYQLISFTAQKVSNGVLLTWKTNNESTYTGFGIDKQDGSNTQYKALYNVQGNGNGVYTYIDHNPATGNNTYRLLQNDIDDNLSYTNTLNVLYNASAPSGVGVLSVYPNPARQLITVNFNSTDPLTASTYEANIYNASGVLVMKKVVSSNSWSQDVGSLQPGAYVIEMKSNSGNLLGNAKFVKI